MRTAYWAIGSSSIRLFSLATPTSEAGRIRQRTGEKYRARFRRVPVAASFGLSYTWIEDLDAAIRLCLVERVAGILTRAGMLLAALAILASAGYGYVYITDRPTVPAGEVTNADDSAANPRSVEVPAARDSERTPTASASAAPSSAS